jgi:hypothetical protein
MNIIVIVFNQNWKRIGFVEALHVCGNSCLAPFPPFHLYDMPNLAGSQWCLSYLLASQAISFSACHVIYPFIDLLAVCADSGW